MQEDEADVGDVPGICPRILEVIVIVKTCGAVDLVQLLLSFLKVLLVGEGWICSVCFHEFFNPCNR